MKSRSLGNIVRDFLQSPAFDIFPWFSKNPQNMVKIPASVKVPVDDKLQKRIANLRATLPIDNMHALRRVK